jgi:hypothetical protein
LPLFCLWLKIITSRVLLVVKNMRLELNMEQTNCNDVFVIDVMEKPEYLCCPYVKPGNNIQTIDPDS